ncbi:MAG: SsrA-binding protein SmpB [Atopobiaceae bacterium]|nr:SsrA-binding protein SmpB [Atopobiaceae bacterium]MDO4404093.1 SsrA-binding protein SmpB [Atopobiaceae bacterium]
MPAKKPGKEVPGKRGKKTIARNRTARHDYEITETYEAGIVLTGTEVKSLRERACQLTDAFCIVRSGEVWLVNAHIHPYSNGGVWNVDPDRRRKLLLHRRQINSLDARLRTKGLALVPLELYFDEHNRVKLTIGVGRGKKLYDKRHDMAQRQSDRDIQRALKERNR